MQTRTFSKGEVIFREGDDSSEAYRILSGDVAIAIATAAGAESIAHLYPGAIFGEMSLIDDKPRSATATALSDCRVEVFNEDNFTERVLGDQENLMLYLTTVFDRVRSVDALLQQHLNLSSGTGPKQSVEAVFRHSITKPAPPAAEVRLVSDAGAARHARPVDVKLTRFPFRIGRAADGRGPSPLAPNDLSIPDQQPFHLSRNHCLIERSGEGFQVRDFGSKVGTIVNGEAIGTDHESFVAPLKRGENTLVLGGEEGPHHFKVVVS